MTCPYYTGSANNRCNLFDTRQPDSHRDAYCLGKSKDYRDCPNYKKMKEYNGGTVPSKYIV